MDAVRNFFSIDLFHGNDVGDLLLFAGAIAASIVIARGIQYLFREKLSVWAEASKTNLDDMILATFEKPIYWIVIAGGIGVALGILSMPAGLEKLSSHVITLVVMFFIAWSSSNLVGSFSELYLDPLAARTETTIDDHIIPIAEKSLKAAIWVFAILVAFDNMGFDIFSILTGLGIGGLAFAMAAKETLSNVFGSLTIFADRPFQLNDLVTIKGKTGFVTEMGLRTVRLLTQEGTVITVPNGLLVGDSVENLSATGGRRSVVTVGMTYETSSEDLEAAMVKIRGILQSNEHVRDDHSVRLANFGSSALELSIRFSVMPAERFLETRGEVNLAVKRAFDENGWNMAYPTMTVYRK